MDKCWNLKSVCVGVTMEMEMWSNCFSFYGPFLQVILILHQFLFLGYKSIGFLLFVKYEAAARRLLA